MNSCGVAAARETPLCRRAASHVPSRDDSPPSLRTKAIGLTTAFRVVPGNALPPVIRARWLRSQAKSCVRIRHVVSWRCRASHICKNLRGLVSLTGGASEKGRCRESSCYRRHRFHRPPSRLCTRVGGPRGDLLCARSSTAAAAPCRVELGSCRFDARLLSRRLAAAAAGGGCGRQCRGHTAGSGSANVGSVARESAAGAVCGLC
jgi:hypothetical protein